jgi:serine/threonine protein kinase
VYKSLKNRYTSDKRLNYLKSIFQEAIIQTLLQSDTSYGKYVCKLYKVYKVGNDCVFQMEHLETTLGRYIQANEEAYEENPEPINIMVRKTAVKVLEIINYFNTTYGFSHNDLSLDNVMITKEGTNPKLIDFGLSSIKFDSIQIGKQLKTRYDPTYLLYKLWLYLDINPTEFSNTLETLTMLPPETPIQTYIDALEPKPKTPKKRRKTRKN